MTVSFTADNKAGYATRHTPLLRGLFLSFVSEKHGGEKTEHESRGNARGCRAEAARQCAEQSFFVNVAPHALCYEIAESGVVAPAPAKSTIYL